MQDRPVYLVIVPLAGKPVSTHRPHITRELLQLWDLRKSNRYVSALAKTRSSRLLPHNSVRVACQPGPDPVGVRVPSCADNESCHSVLGRPLRDNGLNKFVRRCETSSTDSIRPKEICIAELTCRGGSITLPTRP